MRENRELTKNMLGLSELIGKREQILFAVPAALLVSVDTPEMDLKKTGVVAFTDDNMHYYRKSWGGAEHLVTPLAEIGDVEMVTADLGGEGQFPAFVFPRGDQPGWAVLPAPDSHEFLLTSLAKWRIGGLRFAADTEGDIAPPADTDDGDNEPATDTDNGTFGPASETGERSAVGDADGVDAAQTPEPQAAEPGGEEPPAAAPAQPAVPEGPAVVSVRPAGGTDDFTQLADRLEDLARAHADGDLSDVEYTQRVKAVVEGTDRMPAIADTPPPSSPPPTPSVVALGPPPGPRGSQGVPKGALIGAGVAVGVILVALIGFFALRGGSGGTADAESSVAAPLASYTAATRPVRARLAASAKVTNRTLERTSGAGDLGPLVRTARQQLAAVNKARSDLAELRPQGARARRAHGLLVRATGAHRRLLVGLSRIDADNPAAGLDQFPALVTSARAGVAAYRQYASLLGIPAAAVTQEGLADLSGVRQALRARETQIANEAAEAQDDSGGDGNGGGNPSSGALQITSVSAQDNGSYLAVYGSYCDRTPGRVNSFVYTATIYDGGTVVASNSVSADQTRACNTIEVDLTDDLGLGTYTATFTVDNLTNNVSATGSAPITVID